MNLHTLKPAQGSVKKNRRIARGQGSGGGGTATRGHKGSKSRSGFKNKRNFEGGQMPIQMRLPKRGFKNPNRTNYVPLNLDQIQSFADKYNVTEVSLETLMEHGVVRKNELVKVLGNGALQSALTVKVHKVSASAKEAVEAKGGSVTIVE